MGRMFGNQVSVDNDYISARLRWKSCGDMFEGKVCVKGKITRDAEAMVSHCDEWAA